MKRIGQFILGGAILYDQDKMIGSMMIVQIENESDLKNWLATGPYILGRVWDSWEIHPFRVGEIPLLERST